MRRTLICAGFLVIGTALGGGCQPSLIRDSLSLKREPPTAKLPDRIAILSKIDFIPTNAERVANEDIATLREAVRTALFNSGAFREVRLASKETPPGATYFDFVVRPEIASHTGWWWLIAWPYVWPMTGTWPITPRYGETSLFLKVRVFRPSAPPVQFTINHTREYWMALWGYNRTGPIEASLEECYYEVLEELSARVRKLEKSGQRESPGSFADQSP